jgi:HEAT repeat protein
MSLDSLSDLSSDQKVEIYLDGLTYSDLNIRFNSADSLRKIFDNNSYNAVSLNVKQIAIEPMIEALSLDDAVMRDRIIWALECIGENAIKALIVATQNKVEEVRIPSIYALGKYISFPELRFRALATLIHDEKIEIRQSASSAINCFAQRIGTAKEHSPLEITPEHQMICEELKCLLRKNLQSEELKIPQFTQQALNWLEK